MVIVGWRSTEDQAQHSRGNPSSSTCECDSLEQAATFVMEKLSDADRKTVTIRDGLRLVEMPEIEQIYRRGGQA